MAMSSWDGDSNLIHPLNIASQCKPILIFSKGPWKARDRCKRRGESVALAG